MVEIIAVISIMSIIAIIALPTYNNVSQKIKQQNLANKENVIKNQMLKYAQRYLIDEIKPSCFGCCQAPNTCNNNIFTDTFDLYQFITAKGIYDAETFDNDGKAVIINPVTNKKLCGSVNITYNITNNLGTQTIPKLDATFMERSCEKR